MKRLLKQSATGISFIELLLDETLCNGEIYVDKELIRQAGGVNEGLPAKRKYECILRIAKEMPVVFVEDFVEEQADSFIMLDDDMHSKQGWKTDCYVIGKYSELLVQYNVFDAAIAGVLEEASQHNRYEETIAFLEKMIGRTDAYHAIDSVTQPILIYKGDDVCHNVLTIFAEQFGEALERYGCKVEYFDVSQMPIEELLQYQGRYFKAIIGVQSYLFSVKMKDEIHYLHEYIHGPKFNFIFDHPVWMKKHLEHRYEDFYVLTHDMDYVSFVEKYFERKAYLFPPAGMQSNPINGHMNLDTGEQRIYDLTFVGTYGDFMQEILLIHGMERKQRFLANRFLLMMRKNPNLSSEEALKRTLEYYHENISDAEFVELFFSMRRVIYCVMHYYRYKIVKEILESGIQLDVFGDSWYHCPLKVYPNLICHPNVTVEESLRIWQQSKLSLNIMSWHKAGFTERMANIMLAGAVLVTDNTRYLEQECLEDEMIVFDLKEYKHLPERIKYYLLHDEVREEMAISGMKKTLQKHTWDNRAEKFLNLLKI